MSEMAKSSDLPFYRAAAVNIRGYEIWWKVNPKIILSPMFCAIVDGLAPYVGIYLSARIINELAGPRNVHMLTMLVLASLISAAMLTMLSAGLQRWKKCQQGGWWYTREKIISDKLLSMDFDKIDDPYIHDLMSQIWQANNMSGGWGLAKLIGSLEPMAKSVMTIAGAAALTVSLFIQRVAAENNLSILNNPLFIVLIIAILLAITLLAPMLANKAGSYWPRYAAQAKMINRYFAFFSWCMGERARALDVRVYRQDRFAQSMIAKNKIYTPDSEIVRWAKGPMGGLSAASGTVSQTFTGAAYIFICLKALGGAFGIGSVTQYVASITALSGGISALISNVGDLYNNAPFLQTVFEFLDTPNGMCHGEQAVERRPDNKYDIEFNDVSFKYPGHETYALRHVSLKFTAGERLAVVGMNGSGKTTFIKLLCRLYDPTEGEILLNGLDIRKYNYQDYMSIFSIVFQDFKLLSFSLGQNVAAKMTFDANRAMLCLEGAGFGTRTTGFPSGLETNLYKDFDEKGVDISGGEAQKIALARALYKDAAFIILDEPTAALDPVAEFEVYSKMNEIVGKKTAVFISHRLSSCRFCQNIVVFHKGEIIQRGGHNALVADEKGKYYELWNAQAQYYTANN